MIEASRHRDIGHQARRMVDAGLLSRSGGAWPRTVRDASRAVFHVKRRGRYMAGWKVAVLRETPEAARSQAAVSSDGPRRG